MLLSSIRLEDIDPQQIIKMSFLQFQVQAKVPALKEQREQLSRQVAGMPVEQEEALGDVLAVQEHSEHLKEQLRATVTRPEVILEYLRIGRLVRVKHRGTDWGWGLLVNWSTRKARRREDGDKEYILDIVVHVCPPAPGVDPRPAALEEEGVIMVIPFVLEALLEVSGLVVNLPENITAPESKVLIKETLKSIRKKHPFPPPLVLAA